MDPNFVQIEKADQGRYDCGKIAFILSIFIAPDMRRYRVPSRKHIYIILTSLNPNFI